MFLFSYYEHQISPYLWSYYLRLFDPIISHIQHNQLVHPLLTLIAVVNHNINCTIVRVVTQLSLHQTYAYFCHTVVGVREGGSL